MSCRRCSGEHETWSYDCPEIKHLATAVQEKAAALVCVQCEATKPLDDFAVDYGDGRGHCAACEGAEVVGPGEWGS